VGSSAAYEFPAPGRHLAVDERGIGLRATWHLSRGFVNLSLWRGDRCVETFHLTPAEAGRLVNFLVSGLAEAVPEPGQAQLTVVADHGDERSVTDRLTTGVTAVMSNSRRQLAEILERTAARLNRS
jgi:hypothetical protein